MRCSSRVTVQHLKRFLLQKLRVPALYDVSCVLYLLLLVLWGATVYYIYTLPSFGHTLHNCVCVSELVIYI